MDKMANFALQCDVISSNSNTVQKGPISNKLHILSTNEQQARLVSESVISLLRDCGMVTVPIRWTALRFCCCWRWRSQTTRSQFQVLRLVGCIVCWWPRPRDGTDTCQWRCWHAQPHVQKSAVCAESLLLFKHKSILLLHHWNDQNSIPSESTASAVQTSLPHTYRCGVV